MSVAGSAMFLPSMTLSTSPRLRASSAVIQWSRPSLKNSCRTWSTGSFMRLAIISMSDCSNLSIISAIERTSALLPYTEPCTRWYISLAYRAAVTLWRGLVMSMAIIEAASPSITHSTSMSVRSR